MEKNRAAKRALISVFDKTGIVPFAQFLYKAGVEIISTNATAKTLRDAGIPVTEISDYTGYPEMLGGRVKTLHPKIHGGLLYVRGDAEHEQTIQKHGIGSIDILVANLYPFEKIVAKPDATIDEIIESIDIGGPALIRSASKNYGSVLVITDPADYDSIIEEIKTKGGITPARRKDLAGKAFARTAVYDAAIAAYFGKKTQEEIRILQGDAEVLPAKDFKVVTKRQPTAEELKAMLSAWRIVKQLKNTPVTFVAQSKTSGASAAASGTAFHTAATLNALADAGATAVIQPGGSIKDAEVIAAADARGMTMAFTNTRHSGTGEKLIFE